MALFKKKCGITFTFGNQGENHPGMQKIGKEIKEGLNLDDLMHIQEVLNKDGLECILYDLKDLIITEDNDEQLNKELKDKLDDAYVLVIKNLCNEFYANALLEENLKYEWDSKYYCSRRKKVLNKHARHNVCFEDEGSEADYENCKGTIISYDVVPNLRELKDKIKELLREKGENLICEGNLYYNLDKTGIGWHGDTERKIVFGCRIGETHPICFKWWYRNKSFGNLLNIELNNGDAYVMSEKTVGSDWKKSSIPTIRHSAGCKKYTDVKK